MLDSLKKMLGLSAGEDYKALLQNGAVIIDVRSPEEFRSGHIRQSINIPLGSLSSQLSKINKNKPVITCCASGMRSASAKAVLKAAGFEQVYNGGGWTSLQGKI